MFSGTDRYAPEPEDFLCFSLLRLNAPVNILQWFQLHLNQILSLLLSSFLLLRSRSLLRTTPADGSDRSQKKIRTGTVHNSIFITLKYKSIYIFIAILERKDQVKKRTCSLSCSMFSPSQKRKKKKRKISSQEHEGHSDGLP